MNKISFEKASIRYKPLIFSWLSKKHIQEFWDNTQDHKDDIINFMEGRKVPSSYCGGKYVYWIALLDKKPYAMLMTIQETPEEEIGKLKISQLSKTGNSYGIDFMIGSTQHLNKGLGAKTLLEFLDFFRKEFDKKADTFLIDPACNNPKAKHVYQSAGFRYIGDFTMEGNVSGTGKLHHLLIKKFPSSLALPITSKTIKSLISKQFPRYSALDISPVANGGIDNYTFHLGDHMLIRLPKEEGYAPQVLKEQAWLPFLAKHLKMQIPTPLHQGTPCDLFPWHWSIYSFISGRSIASLHLSKKTKEQLAYDLANFLKNLHKIPTRNAPAGGIHNYHRGCHPSIYDRDIKRDMEILQSLIDTEKVLAIWESAKKSTWHLHPVWVHGDVAIGNLIMENQELKAVIDFGCMGIGDPACDLVMAWTFFDRNSRKTFKKELGLDAATWERAKAWALWKAGFELVAIEDKTSVEASRKIHIIQEVITDTK